MTTSLSLSSPPPPCRRDLRPGILVEHRHDAPVAIIRRRHAPDNPILIPATHPLARLARLAAAQTLHPAGAHDQLWPIETAHLFLSGGLPLPQPDLRALQDAVEVLRVTHAHVPAVHGLLTWAAVITGDGTPTARRCHALTSLMTGLRRYERLLRTPPRRPEPSTRAASHDQVWDDLPAGYLAPAIDAITVVEYRSTRRLYARLGTTSSPGALVQATALDAAHLPVVPLGTFTITDLAGGVPLPRRARPEEMAIAIHTPGRHPTSGVLRDRVLDQQHDLRAALITRLTGLGERPFLAEERLHPGLLLPNPPRPGLRGAISDMTTLTSPPTSRVHP